MKHTHQASFGSNQQPVSANRYILNSVFMAYMLSTFTFEVAMEQS